MSNYKVRLLFSGTLLDAGYIKNTITGIIKYVEFAKLQEFKIGLGSSNFNIMEFVLFSCHKLDSNGLSITYYDLRNEIILNSTTHQYRFNIQDQVVDQILKRFQYRDMDFMLEGNYE